MQKDIDMICNFEDLIKIREEAFLINSKNDFNFDSILAGLYKDPSHFIFELIQNAEDVGAKEVSIELKPDELIFSHDSPKDFDFEDIKAITGIGQSTKLNEINKIGKFGIGFKSVFAVTETPYIYSGDYSFKIENFYVPRIIEKRSDLNKGTTIILPFNHKLRSREKVFRLIEDAFSKLDSKVLLFLKNIEEIYWKTPHSHGSFVKHSESVRECRECRFINMLSEYDNMEEMRYLLFERPLSFNKKLSVSIAFRIGKEEKRKEGKEGIIPERNSKLVVFFPTETVTFLSFIINGPYRTTPNRENIPEDNIDNIKILEETSQLFADSIIEIKKLGYLNVQVIDEVFPVDKRYCDSSIIYKHFYETTKAVLCSQKVLPTHQGGFTDASNAVLARGSDLTELYDSTDLKYFFDKEYWLSTDITNDRTPVLRRYLMQEADVEEVTFDDFCKEITEEFMESKDDDWVKRFYVSLLNHRELVKPRGLLRNKPIIRTQLNKHIKPYINDTVNAFLFADGISAAEKTVKKTLVEDDEVIELMKLLGLSKADDIDVLREEIIKLYCGERVSVNEDDYYLHLSRIIQLYSQIGNEGKKRLAQLLSDCYIVLSEEKNGSSRALRKPNEVYLRTSELLQLYENCPQKYFVDKKILEKFITFHELNDFFIKIGVNQYPKRIRIRALSYEEKLKMHPGISYPHEVEENYTIDGLDNILHDMTIEKSHALWNILLKMNRDYFVGTYKWSYSYASSTEEIKAYFVSIINSSKWLLNNNGEWKAPKEIRYNDLSNEYSSYINTAFAEFIDFEPSDYDRLPVEIRNKIELVKNIPLEVLEQLSNEYNKVDNISPEEHIIEELPNQSISEIKEWNFENSAEDFSDAEGEGNTSSNNEKENSDSDSDSDKEDEDVDYSLRKKIVIKTTTNERKLIGKWGEEKVLESLELKYINKGYEISDKSKSGFSVETEDGFFEIKYMNADNDIQKGYDILINKDGEPFEYIEVKSKLSDEKELVSISGTQWEFAKQLYEKGMGKLYSIYIVSNVGKETARIDRLNNPYEFWIKGKLYAHPVHLKL